MTITEFINQLKKLPPRLRGKARSWVKNAGIGNTNCYCPITAVVKHLTGDTYDVSDACLVGKKIGLSKRDTYSIMTQADSKDSKRKLRQRMLNALM